MTVFKTAALAALLSLGTTLSACKSNDLPEGAVAYSPQQYALAAGDRLRIVVFGEAEMSKEYLVSSAGDVAMPLVGKVAVTGETVDTLKQKIGTTLGNGFLNDPQVTVEVLNYRPFFILGEVNSPGKYPADDELSVTQAIALAGGYSYRANKNRVFLRRAGQPGEEVYDLDDGRVVYVGPGDTLRIGERFF